MPFFFSFFKEIKEVGWEVVKHPHPAKKTFTKITGVFFQRERAKVGMMYQPVCPEEINNESSSWWKVSEGEENYQVQQPHSQQEE